VLFGNKGGAMLCPVCPDTQLVMTERQSIEIDYCPKCRGVWLDRGELDKIIERSEHYEHPQVDQPGSAMREVAPQQPDQPQFQQASAGYGEQSFGHSAGRRDEENSFVRDSQGGHGFLKRLFD
jgi:Zn-finger nucleic acid-binding protein